MISIEDRGVVYHSPEEPGNRRAASFTSLLRTSNGEILCGFQVASSKNAGDSTIMIFRSNDDAQTWRRIPFAFETSFDNIPGSLGSVEITETSPGLLFLVATWFDRSDPHRPFFDPITEGILHSRLLAAESLDGGNTWSEWRPLPTEGLTGCTGTGPILTWPDGTVVVPFESFREFDDPVPHSHTAWALVSRDRSKTFSAPVITARDASGQRYYWDQRLCAGPDPGEYLALFWTHDLVAKKDVSVHFKFASVLQRDQISHAPVPTRIPGQIAAPIRLADGRIAAFVVMRGETSNLTLWISADKGATWPENASQVIYTHAENAKLTQGPENVNFGEYWEDMRKWSFGHPAICVVDDHHLLLAYYAGEPSCMSVHWARVHLARP